MNWEINSEEPYYKVTGYNEDGSVAWRAHADCGIALMESHMRFDYNSNKWHQYVLSHGVKAHRPYDGWVCYWNDSEMTFFKEDSGIWYYCDPNIQGGDLVAIGDPSRGAMVLKIIDVIKNKDSFDIIFEPKVLEFLDGIDTITGEKIPCRYVIDCDRTFFGLIKTSEPYLRYTPTGKQVYLINRQKKL